ncbi:hypothetical protein TNCV_2432571 [Trichonephila clavipes]|nr:hypothetical protein TNCV_2432571 [Trichonephila clavipes]
MHSLRSVYGFDFVLLARTEQKPLVERASDKLAGKYICGSQSQAVFARRRSKSKLKLLDIRAELERRENARGARAGVTF